MLAGETETKPGTSPPYHYLIILVLGKIQGKHTMAVNVDQAELPYHRAVQSEYL